jgi:aryl-alcohol dehydrogenase-like predicted oxidoreductase
LAPFAGSSRRSAAKRSLVEIQAFTKWVPRPGLMTRDHRTSDLPVRARMGVGCLDLLQFHWWDYGDRRFLDALRHLAELKSEGKIGHLALTNFDT